MQIYLDLLMLINFAVDFLLLMGTNRLSGFPVDAGRCARAALLGSVYSGACLLPGFIFLGNTIWRVISLSLIAVVAFGWNRSAWNRTGVFILLSMALGGIVLGLGKRTWVMLVCGAAGVWFLCRMGFDGNMGRSYVPVEVCYENRRIHVIALRDTGNSLRDPITGEPVIVLGADGAEKLVGLREQTLQNPMEAMMGGKGFRLIPYRTVGQPGGMLLGIRADVTVDGTRSSRIVAFAPEQIGKGQCYQALVC